MQLLWRYAVGYSDLLIRDIFLATHVNVLLYYTIKKLKTVKLQTKNIHSYCLTARTMTQQHENSNRQLLCHYSERFISTMMKLYFFISHKLH